MSRRAANTPASFVSEGASENVPAARISEKPGASAAPTVGNESHAVSAATIENSAPGAAKAAHAGSGKSADGGNNATVGNAAPGAAKAVCASGGQEAAVGNVSTVGNNVPSAAEHPAFTLNPPRPQENLRTPVERTSRPPWLRVRFSETPGYLRVKRIAEEQRLNTVCQSARCPNQGECWAAGTATFMIGGAHCTRRCGFCDIATARPEALDPLEPARVARAVAELGLRFAVITCVARDDLADGGAAHMAAVLRALHRRTPHTGIEVLISDYQGDADALSCVLDANPDVLNHNLETVERLQKRVRPAARYARSLQVLRRARERRPDIPTKSGLMLGLGERADEVEQALCDLREAGVSLLTLGQYMRPSGEHLPVARWAPPEEFDAWRERALELGFSEVASGPLVRSSYRAERLARAPQPLRRRDG